METRKYKLVRPSFFSYEDRMWQGQKIYRLKALRDIPLHGVKKGDFGGYVTSPSAVSHDGNCWIGQQAVTYGDVTLKDDAYIGGTASVVCDRARYISITGNSQIIDEARVRVEATAKFNGGIFGDVIISGSAYVKNPKTIFGMVEIRDRCSIIDPLYLVGDQSHLVHEEGGEKARKTIIAGDVNIAPGAEIHCSTIDGAFNIAEKAEFLNADITESSCIIDGAVTEFKDIPGIVYNMQALKNRSITNEDIALFLETLNMKSLKAETKTSFKPAVKAASAVDKAQQAIVDDAILLLQEITEKNASYESDIVKLIKFPVMVDRSFEATAEFHVALNRANRLAKNPEHPDFPKAVKEAEKAFIIAEATALKVATTSLNEQERRKVSKASNLISLAGNEASTEQEKKAAFEQVFKQLEGVIAVPAVAVETFRVKIGLKELQA